MRNGCHQSPQSWNEAENTDQSHHLHNLGQAQNAENFEACDAAKIFNTALRNFNGIHYNLDYGRCDNDKIQPVPQHSGATFIHNVGGRNRVALCTNCKLDFKDAWNVPILGDPFAFFLDMCK